MALRILALLAAVELAAFNEFIGALLAEHGERLYRYKGILSVKGHDAKFVLQGVHMNFRGECNPGARWRRGEPRLSKLVLIGRGLGRTPRRARGRRASLRLSDLSPWRRESE